MMDTWIELARGPLFRISLAILVLGLGYRFTVAMAQIVASWRRAGDRAIPAAAVAKATLGWIFPRRALRARPFYSAASILFHVGILVVPPFLLGHVALLGGWLPAGWPTLGPAAADTLTIAGILALGFVLAGRIATRSARALSRFQDVAVVAVLFLVMLFGFLGAHPALSPFDARAMVLLHMLLGNLALILTPTTKIAHCVLYPLTQLIFQLGWHFPAESGRHVMVALGKENEPV
jgi:nitrate reductase gamma subunit